MTGWRPTALRMASQHCPRAVTYYNEGRPYDRRIYATGSVAHAIIQECLVAAKGGQVDEMKAKAIADATAARLIKTGRFFEGDLEPSLPLDSVMAGRELALRHLAGLEHLELGESAKIEVGLAVDRNWKPIPYGPKAYLRLIADLVEIRQEIDEESHLRVLEVTDYKSAWPTGPDELRTVQRKAQALLAHAHFGHDADTMRLVVVNLRTGARYEEDVDDMALLDEWRSEIDLAIESLEAGRDKDGYRLAPGGGCIDCPFNLSCQAGRDWRESFLGTGDTAVRAAVYAKLVGDLEALKKVLRQELAEEEIPVGGGKVLGTRRLDQKVPVEDAWASIGEEWTSRGGDVAGILKEMGVTSASIHRLAKVLYPEDRDERDRWIEDLMDLKGTRRWGLWDET